MTHNQNTHRIIHHTSCSEANSRTPKKQSRIESLAPLETRMTGYVAQDRVSRYYLWRDRNCIIVL